MIRNFSINAHSSIKYSGTPVIYFDPYQIPSESHDADIIFFTHSHYDHLSPDDVALIRKPETIFVAPKSIEKDLDVLGSDSSHIVLLEPDDSTEVLGVKIEAVRAHTPEAPFHPKENNWLGYVVVLNGLRYYICGDTYLTDEAKAVKCDVLFAPIGGKYTMNAEQAAELANTIHPRAAVPTHYACIIGEKEDADVFRAEVDKDIEVETLIK